MPPAQIKVEGQALAPVQALAAGRMGVLGAALGLGAVVATEGNVEVGRLPIDVRTPTAAYATCPEPMPGGMAAGWVTLDAVGRLPRGLQPSAGAGGVVLGACPKAGAEGSGECYLFQRTGQPSAPFYVQPDRDLIPIKFSTGVDGTLDN